ncbi:MAG TPA: F0F1 ATP synthase subunit B, partial [Woeseiaceae bacterium]
MDINMTLLGQSIAMLVFVWFCMKFIWPPIMNAIEERQTKIADGLAAAERGQKSLDDAKSEAGKIIGDARKQATGILDQAHARANEIVAEGKAEG